MLLRRLSVGIVSVLVAGVVTAAPAYAAAPTVSSFSPSSGPSATSVTITGSNFVAPATVKFSGTASSTVTVVSATSVRATVPSTAGSGPISVTTAGGTGTSAASFTVTPGLTRSPTVGPPGTVSAVSVSGFGAGEAVDVYLDGTAQTVAVTKSTGTTSVSITVPKTATPGTHWFTAVGRKSGSAAQATFTVRTNWTRPGFGNARAGVNPYENTLTTSNVADLDTRWDNYLGLRSYSTPAVVGGIVYDTFISGDVIAYDATTGVKKWQTDVSALNATYGSPVVDAGVVFIGSDDGSLYALNATTGALKWKFTTSGAINSVPVVTATSVYVPSNDGHVYAVDNATGSLKWTNSLPSGTKPYGLALAGEWLYFGASDNVVRRVYAPSGANGWTYASSGTPYNAPAVVGNRVYVTTLSGSLACLSASSGSVQWSASLSSSILATSTVYRGKVYVGDNVGNVAAYDAQTGSSVWSRSLSPYYAVSPIAAANGVLYSGSANGPLFALDAVSGATLSTFPLGSPGGVVVADGAVYGQDWSEFNIARFDLTAGGTVAGEAVARPVPAQLRRRG